MRLKAFALLLLVLTLAVIVFLPAMSAADEEGTKCDCVYTQTKEYGVIREGDCHVENCWIPIMW